MIILLATCAFNSLAVMQPSMTNQKLKLFISYGREDITNDFAEKLYGDLNEYGCEPVLDVKDFIAGQSLSEMISTKKANCDVIIVILSKKYSKSDWCVGELTLAKDKQKEMILIKHEECDISDQVKFLMGDRLYLKFITDQECEKNFDKLITALEKVASYNAIG